MMEVSYPDERVFLAFLTLLVLDCVWLLVISRRLRVYPKFANVKLGFAAIAYFCAALALSTSRAVNVTEAGVFGLTVGLLIWGVFNATEASIQEDWRGPHAIIDACWGGFVCFATSLVIYAIGRHPASTVTSIVLFVLLLIAASVATKWPRAELGASA